MNPSAPYSTLKLVASEVQEISAELDVIFDPDSVAALHRTVENTDLSCIAVHEAVAYPNLDVLISWIELL